MDFFCVLVGWLVGGLFFGFSGGFFWVKTRGFVLVLFLFLFLFFLTKKILAIFSRR